MVPSLDVCIGYRRVTIPRWTASLRQTVSSLRLTTAPNIIFTRLARTSGYGRNGPRLCHVWETEHLIDEVSPVISITNQTETVG